MNVVLQSKRRARALLIQKLQHVVPSVFLLFDGLGRVQAPGSAVGFGLGVAEIGIAGLVIALFRHQFLEAARAPQPAGHQSHGPDWVDVGLGVMLFVEAVVHQQETHHLPRPTLLLGAVMLVIGFGHGRLSSIGNRRRTLAVDERGIAIPRRFTRANVTWADVAAVEVTPVRGTVRTTAGAEHHLVFAEFLNGEAMRQTFSAARRQFTTRQTAAADGSHQTPAP